MTLAAKAPVHAPATDSSTSLPVVPALIVLALLVAWIGATAVWGWNGFIGVADVVVLVTFAVILSATRQ